MCKLGNLRLPAHISVHVVHIHLSIIINSPSYQKTQDIVMSTNPCIPYTTCIIQSHLPEVIFTELGCMIYLYCHDTVHTLILGHTFSDTKRQYFHDGSDSTMESPYIPLTENTTITPCKHDRLFFTSNAPDKSPVSPSHTSSSTYTLPSLQQPSFTGPSTQSSHSVPRGMSYNYLCNSYS